MLITTPLKKKYSYDTPIFTDEILSLFPQYCELPEILRLKMTACHSSLSSVL